MADMGAHFKALLAAEPDLPTAVAAVRTLIQAIKESKSTTMMELREEIKSVIQLLTSSVGFSISLSSGCDLFMRFVTRTALDSNFEECKRLLIERGNIFVEKAASSRVKIAQIGTPFIRDGATILTHARSRVINRLLVEAVKANKRINVIVTESRPDNAGYACAKFLEEAGIPVTVILDAAVGYVMEKADLVLVGAEGVVESGGIINKIGTYQIAVVAKAANKPVYAVAESFKFVRLFPLNQYDLPTQSKSDNPFVMESYGPLSGVKFMNPSVDYTPPAYISLLFTDLGVLTPSAVSDELIKLYY
eukprot:Opistho-1_new@97823